MFSAIYTGYSGLSSFSKGLDVLSNNISNMNTPGYKGNDLIFRDLYYKTEYQYDDQNIFVAAQLGSGVSTGSTTTRFAQGDFRSTGNSTDVAIDGNGFFVIRNNDEILYTRAGQFEFDADGYLVEKSGKGRVMAIDGQGNLSAINLNDHGSEVPVATTEIRFSQNLSGGSISHEISDVTVIDSNGEQHALSIRFDNNDINIPRSWLVEVTDESGNIVSSGGQIRFEGNGSLTDGFNTTSFDFSPTGADATTITLNFGEPGTFSDTTSFTEGTISTLEVRDQNGYGVGVLTNYFFNAEGQLTVNYSNGQQREHEQLAIADFRDLQLLERVGGNMFKASETIGTEYAAANNEGMGRIVGGSLELSNVDLTQQFTDMVIIQRGYQASSQVLSTANEMAQQLLEMMKGR